MDAVYIGKVLIENNLIVTGDGEGERTGGAAQVQEEVGSRVYLTWYGGQVNKLANIFACEIYTHFAVLLLLLLLHFVKQVCFIGTHTVVYYGKLGKSGHNFTRVLIREEEELCCNLFVVN